MASAHTEHTQHHEPGNTRYCAYWLMLAVFFAAATAITLNSQPLRSANDRSRWCTVLSLVDLGTYQIDAIDANPRWSTIDKVRHQRPGEDDYHFYSSKPPLLSTIVAGIYWVAKRVGGGDLFRNTQTVAQSILLVVNVVPMLLALVVLVRLVERYAQTDFARLFIVGTAAFGTLLNPFLTTLNNHTVAAVCLVFSLYPAIRIVVDGTDRRWHFVAAGFFAALTVTFELPAALFGVAMFGVLAYRNLPRTIKWFVPAALVPNVAFFVTNWIATGGWKPFYMYFGTDKYIYTHEGIPSYWSNPSVIDIGIDSPLLYFLHCTIGHHGILSLSPVFALALATWLMRLVPVCDSLRLFVRMGMLLSLCILGFYLTKTGSYNYGGNSCALRWMLWLTPFWLISLIPILDRFSDRRSFRIVACCLLAFSTFSSASALSNPWQQPWLYRAMESAGWIDYRTPPADGGRSFPTWFPSIPELAEQDASKWIEFQGIAADGSSERLRLTAHGTADADHCELTVRSSYRSHVEESRFRINIAEFAAGHGPERFLHFSSDRPTGRQLADVLAFFRGVPAGRRYRTGAIRHVRLPVRRDAFRCIRAATRVLHPLDRQQAQHWYRCDLWLSEEVPFGTLILEQTITTPRGDLVGRRRLTAVDWSGRDGGAASP